VRAPARRDEGERDAEDGPAQHKEAEGNGAAAPLKQVFGARGRAAAREPTAEGAGPEYAGPEGDHLDLTLDSSSFAADAPSSRTAELSPGWENEQLKQQLNF
jgi:hypothetical protein